MITAPSYTLLATGDAEPDVQKLIHPPKVKYLKVAHHGSRYQDIEFNALANPEVAIISVGVGNKYKFKCLKCNQEFLDSLDDGNFPQCEKCNPRLIEKSLIEKEIQTFLQNELNINNLIINDRTICDGLELDIYIPENKLALEINGNYFHSELGGKKNKYYHVNKTELCESKNIQLIHIFEDEWLFKNDVIKKRIKSILRTDSTNKIFARNCIVKEINTNDYKQFVENNHLQGFTSSKIKLGLFHNDKLISVMSFGFFRKFMGNKDVKEHEYKLIKYYSNTSFLYKNMHNLIFITSKLYKYH